MTVNFAFALPAVKTIDTFGRRGLLLTSFPLMAVFLLLTGFAFYIPSDNKAHLAIIALGIYLFGAVYSPGAGPVPFTVGPITSFLCFSMTQLLTTSRISIRPSLFHSTFAKWECHLPLPLAGSSISLFQSPFPP